MNSSYGRSQAPPSSRAATAVDDGQRWTTTVGLELEVNSFKVGKMRIRCVAELYGVFKTTAETVLDEEKPRLASILGTFSSAGKRQINIISYVLSLSSSLSKKKRKRASPARPPARVRLRPGRRPTTRRDRAGSGRRASGATRGPSEKCSVKWVTGGLRAHSSRRCNVMVSSGAEGNLFARWSVLYTRVYTYI